uniref:4-coumarate--CoA ligase n=1 Tax=Nelumbo nucifera TaxID=4432 RepID=A0A822YXZ0_NELNU|nr:TPA_asm: hypothetical protein HUJ06_007714 [Nelumbo nucifera]
MLLLPNSLEFIFAFFGVFYVPWCHEHSSESFYISAKIAKQAKASNARLIITQACHVEKLREFAKENDVKIMTTDLPTDGFLHFSELTHSDESEMPAVKIHHDDVVALPYSTGTTGLPKGVMLTHRGLVTSMAQQVDGDNPNMYLHSEDVLLCVLHCFLSSTSTRLSRCCFAGYEPTRQF